MFDIGEPIVFDSVLRSESEYPLVLVGEGCEGEQQSVLVLVVSQLGSHQSHWSDCQCLYVMTAQTLPDIPHLQGSTVPHHHHHYSRLHYTPLLYT